MPPKIGPAKVGIVPPLDLSPAALTVLPSKKRSREDEKIASIGRSLIHAQPTVVKNLHELELAFAVEQLSVQEKKIRLDDDSFEK